MGKNQENRLGALDGLRGVAILLVLWFHLWQLSWLSPVFEIGPFTLDMSAVVRTGFIGVELFFFLSGFCLFYPYAQAHFDGTARPTLRYFADRRARKILPSYAASVAGALLLGYGTLSFPKDAGALARMHALFFLPGFPDEIARVSGVLWSLGVEAQFYLLFPLIAWCLRGRPVVTFLSAVLIASADRMLEAHLHATNLYLFMERLPACLDLFVSGMFTAHAFRFLSVQHEQLARRHALWTLTAVLGVWLFVFCATWIYGAASTPNWPYSLYPSVFPFLDLAFICVTLGSLLGSSAWQRVLANPPLTFLALISYNLYLWHQIVAFEIVHHGILTYQGSDPQSDPSWQQRFTLVAGAAAIAVATALTYGLERPLLHARREERKRPAPPAPAPIPPQ